MKTSILISLVFLLAFPVISANAQEKKQDTIRIATSAQCEMCKNRIEKAMAYEKGVVKSDLDIESKVLTIVYKTAKTDPDRLKKAVTLIGYDADDLIADESAYSKLPPCCKKPDDPDHTGH